MSVMAPPSDLGERIQRRRQELRLTQVELAALVGVSESSIIRWEGGKMPPSKHWGNLEAALGWRRGGGPLTPPLSDEERDRVLQDYLYLHSLLFPQSGDGQANGTAEEGVRDEGRTA